MLKQIAFVTVSTAVLMSLVGCESGITTTDTTLSGSSSTADTTLNSKIDGEGQLKVLLTDAPGDFEAVYVTIDAIQVHKKGECEDSNESEAYTDNNESNETDECDGDSKWITVAQAQKTIDLLTLQNGQTMDLGDANISVGQYTELRMVLGSEEDNGTNSLGDAHPYANYILYTAESKTEALELKVPSERIYVKHDFEVADDGVYELTIDFDANQSIHQAGQSGKWILNPVLKVTGEKTDESAVEEEVETEESTDDNETTEATEVESEDNNESE